MKMYGSLLCPDVLSAIEVLQSKKIEYEFIDITTNLGNLKAFIKLRESNHRFDEVRACDGIGIPCFENKDGEITFNVEDLL